jgi:CRP/FNR family transcriptional regulator, cyclic AMP receptor protein
MGSDDTEVPRRQPRWPAGTLMARLDQQTRDELLHLAPGRFHPSGTVLMTQGAPGSHAYLLRPASGGRAACVKVTSHLENGTTTLLGIRVSGDIVGELAVLSARPRVATVTTCSPLIAHAIPADTFMAFLEPRPEAWKAVSLMIANMLEWANRRRIDYAGHDVTVHIARVILDIVHLYGYRASEGSELGVSLSQPELGSLVGASKEAAAKAVRSLRERGLIETRYRRIIVRDVAGLRAVARLPAAGAGASSRAALRTAVIQPR